MSLVSLIYLSTLMLALCCFWWSMSRAVRGIALPEKHMGWVGSFLGALIGMFSAHMLLVFAIVALGGPEKNIVNPPFLIIAYLVIAILVGGPWLVANTLHIKSAIKAYDPRGWVYIVGTATTLLTIIAQVVFLLSVL